MSRNLTIQIVRDPAYAFGEHLQLEVNGELQPDLIPYWTGERARAGFGYDDTGRNGFGLATSPAFGEGVFGYAGFDAEPAILEHVTVLPFPAGNHVVRVRGRDMIDNLGDWSAPITVYHRPPPPPVQRLRIDGDLLRFDY